MSAEDDAFRPPDDIAALRQQRWRAQRAYVADRSPFFARLWAGRRVPERLEDFSALPLCDKAMLRESQAAHPPFGDYLAAAPEFVVRLHRTSGTTGQAMNIAQTQADAAQTAEVGARCFRAAGLTLGTLTVHCLNYRMWMGGVSDHLALEAAGATVIPFGVGDSQLLVRTILDLKVAAIHCTPSYPAALERTLVEHFPGLAPRDLGLRLGLFGGEAGLDDPRFRARLESVWGFTARNANYGVSDVFSNFASQCRADNDLHFLGEDVLHAELIEPESGDPVPWQEGARGELVLTHLLREAPAAGALPHQRRDRRDRHGRLRLRAPGAALPRARPQRRHGGGAGRQRLPQRRRRRDRRLRRALGRVPHPPEGRRSLRPAAGGGGIGGRCRGLGRPSGTRGRGDRVQAPRLGQRDAACARSAAAHRRQDQAPDPGGLTMAGTVLTETAKGVATLTLNRPERLNALNDALLADLLSALDAALADEAVGALVLRGAGRAFCAGDDLKEIESQTAHEAATRAFIESIQAVTRRLVLGDKVVIGAIHGWAVGGGLEWAIDCDLAVFAESTRCFFPEIAWGMFPTGGVTAILPRIVGLAKTRELLLLGETFGAAQAHEMGLAWRVVPDDAAFEAAHETARKIAALPQAAVRDLKRVLNRAGSLDVEGALALETEATVRRFLDPETAERVKRFGGGGG